jgi:hypothetical protein
MPSKGQHLVSSNGFFKRRAEESVLRAAQAVFAFCGLEGNPG